ncbi:MAG: HlyC/CorC family transporter [Deltaproteobacteria bacterium]|nr:HlyC/CorC family transporter [Deltaproteobacteria bacterium]
MVELFAAAGALVTRAVLQAADAALIALSEEDAREASERSATSSRAKLLLDLKDNPEPTAAALRAASSGLLAFAAVICALWVGEAFPNTPGLMRATHLPLQILAGVLAGAAALVLDLAPRSYAGHRPLAWAIALAWPTWLICRLLRPPVRLLLFLFDRVLIRRGVAARYTPPPPPLEQIEKILSNEARTKGSAPPPEMVHGLFSFAGRQAREVMVPRTQVVGVPLEATREQIADLLAEEGHTRMPVFDGDLDHIKGVLHAKDVIPLLANPSLIVLQDLLRKPLWVPWNMPVGDLLREMQQRRSHLALIVDEYGGFAGVVSIEDILSEIVGDLPEEHEAAPQGLKLGPDGSAIFPADTRIDEVNDALGAQLPDGEGAFKTLGGLLNSCAGSIPQTGDRFFVGGLELTVAQRDDRRVRLVRVHRAQSAPPPLPASGP